MKRQKHDVQKMTVGDEAKEPKYQMMITKQLKHLSFYHNSLNTEDRYLKHDKYAKRAFFSRWNKGIHNTH